MTQEQWGPWIEHDGNGCPCAGEWIQAEDEDGHRAEGIAPDCCTGGARHWYANNPPYVQVIRYRIRKPRGLTILQRIAEQPERVDA